MPDIAQTISARRAKGQIRECAEYAKYNDMEIVGQYIDRAYSAKTDNRPDFQRMIKDSYRKQFDIVLVAT